MMFEILSFFNESWEEKKKGIGRRALLLFLSIHKPSTTIPNILKGEEAKVLQT